MKVATILPVKNLHLEEKNDYHMCLAHIDDREYWQFFRERVSEGHHVLMDNGVVENGIPYTIEKILEIATDNLVTEIVLPDQICDREATLALGEEAITYLAHDRRSLWLDFMAVPQGESTEEWCECAKAMLTWPVRSFGVSRFVAQYAPHRRDLLEACPELLGSDREIHLLGCPDDPREIAEVNAAFPGRIRGVDSGIAAMYSQEGLFAGDGMPKPKVELDFHPDGNQDLSLLESNVSWWRRRCGLNE